MYTDNNYKTKKALREAVEAGDEVIAYQPGGIFSSQTDGKAMIEGPRPVHKWYASVVLKDGKVVKVLK